MQGGFYERVYENAFCLELLAEGIQFERQKPMAVYYRGQVVGEFVADIVVEGAVLLKLKAVLRGLDEEHIAQGIHYLTCLKLPIGLLLNFEKSVQVKRLLNKHFLPQHPCNP